MQLSELVREIFKEKFPPKKVLFRVDAGRIEGLSFGHLSRCLILAKELKRSINSETVFLMRDYTEGLAFARSSGHRVEILHDSSVMEWISRIKPDYLVVDLPGDNPECYLEYARQNQILTISIDDVAKQSFKSDVILNSSILADRKKYGTCLPTTRFLLGMDYFIMDDYCKKGHRKVEKRYISVVITFGGSDPTDLTEKVVSALTESSWDNVSFTVILGPGFKKNSFLRSSKVSLSNQIKIINNPQDLRSYIVDSDLVVSSGGRTLYELYKIGVPTLAIASSECEIDTIKEFREKNLILSGLLSWNKQIFLKELQRAISRTL